MTKKEELLGLTDGYLDGVVDPEIRAEFERIVLEDVDSSEGLLKAMALIEAWKGYIFKQQLREYHKVHMAARDGQPPLPVE